MIMRGGYTNYGQDVGILMLETHFPRLPGDIGNARTFGFPVMYLTISGASPTRIVKERDSTLLKPFIDGARELEKRGVKAITTSCGFLALWQEELAAAVSIPLFTSSLLQIPFLFRIFGGRGTIGVLTARAQSLTQEHFAQCGANELPIVIAGMDESPEFTRVFLEEANSKEDCTMDTDRVRDELILAAGWLIDEHPDIRAVVLECTNMPPFRKEIANKIGKPVFDIVTLTKFIYSGLIADWRI